MISLHVGLSIIFKNLQLMDSNIAGQLVSANITNVITDSTLCRPCPRGAGCEGGGNTVVALPGFWIDIDKSRRTSSDISVIDIYECLPGKPP